MSVTFIDLVMEKKLEKKCIQLLKTELVGIVDIVNKALFICVCVVFLC
jgi:hypothetical protein